MPIQRITIEEFRKLAKTGLVLDVRSPAEYNHAHIPGATSLPLFSDEERKVVGTAYKQQGRQVAIKIGLDYFGVKMSRMVQQVEALIAEHDQHGPHHAGNAVPLLVHCWRGGMRSAGVAWLLDLYGFKVFTLAGGYKAYRKWARDQFELPHPITVLGGYTGSGKTQVLALLKRAGVPVIDLENISNHKGSAFGGMGEPPQPQQEMFENLLAEALASTASKANQQPAAAATIWIEDESQRIGNLKIPDSFWKQMRSSEVLFLDIPFGERLDHLTAVYGRFEKEKLVNAIIRIQKRLGGLETKNAVQFLIEDNHKECFRILLTYYDKWYGKALYNRDNINTLLNKLPFEKVNANEIAAVLLSKLPAMPSAVCPKEPIQ